MDFKFLGIHSPRQHNPLLSASSLSSVSPHNFVSDHPVTEAWLMLDTREAIEREIAKELLRSEILADEIAQQCLKRDMMIEPDTMGQPFGVPVSSLKRNLPPLPSPVVERSSELCLDTSDTKMEDLYSSNNNGEIGPGNFEKSVNNKQPLEIKNLATCDSFDLQEWRCELCQISAPCEKSLNDHLAGKKHQAKMEALNGSKNGDELAPRNIMKSVNKQPVETKISATCVSFDLQEWSCELCQISAPCEKSLNDHLAGKKHRSKLEGLNGSKNGGELGPRNIKKSVDKQPLETKNSATCVSFDLQEWSCELCQISAPCEKSLNDHLAGKKHQAKMEDLNGSKNSIENGLRNFNKSVDKQPMETMNSAKCVSSDLQDWSCSLCQISATSKQGLNDHLAGKKHHSKMEAFNASKNGGEIGLGMEV
ncbi:uncharacterized protein [Rutidosis leptorrhynchoides]|uniref:uncharacterized protein isoform X2 n=1 Tax=Rutidosis leptorrhynchoides TaxID=125765 RepID=UPI003A99B6A7